MESNRTTLTIIITAQPGTSVTVGQNLVLTASGADSFSWSTGATTASINPPTSTSGSFTYSVTGVTANGCSALAQITITVSVSTIPTPPVDGPLAATVLSYNCQTGAIVFGSTGGNGSGVEYLAIGITGWTSNPNQQIEAGLRADPKPVIIQVRQNGLAGNSFVFDFGAYCQAGPQPPTNTPPTVINTVGPQLSTVGVAYSLNLTSVFTDAQTPNGLSLTASGLPQGLSINGMLIGGVPSASGVSQVTLTATDPGSLTATITFTLTVSPTVSTTPNPPVGGPLAATVVSYNCQTGAIIFGSTSSHGSGVEYLAIGITGWTSDPNQVIEAGLRADPKPVVVQVRQNGVAGNSFVFDFGAFCQTGPQPPTNTPPTVVNAVGPQSATVSVGYSLNIGSVFTDAQTPNSLSLVVQGLPQGLSLNSTLISGVPSASGVSTVTLTAIDLGGLSINTSFQLIVSPLDSGTNTTPPTNTVACGSPASSLGSSLQVTGVTDINCLTGSFRILTAGGTGSVIDYSNNVGLSNADPSSCVRVLDNPDLVRAVNDVGSDVNPFQLRVTQNGDSSPLFSFNFKGYCARSSRMASETGGDLEVTVLGNPTLNEFVEVEVRGMGQQAVRLQVVNLVGHIMEEQTIASSTQPIRRSTVRLGGSSGVYVLQVSTPTRSRTVKIVRQ